MDAAADLRSQYVILNVFDGVHLGSAVVLVVMESGSVASSAENAFGKVVGTLLIVDRDLLGPLEQGNLVAAGSDGIEPFIAHQLRHGFGILEGWVAGSLPRYHDSGPNSHSRTESRG